MSKQPSRTTSAARIRALAEFRYTLRRFLHFSEETATRAGLKPQQHQLLLQIAGAPPGTVTTVGYLAERLALRHNSVVELIDRSEREGLLVRTTDDLDRRRAILQVTRKGRRIMDRLADDHAREINELAPQLLKALKRIGGHAKDGMGAGAE